MFFTVVFLTSDGSISLSLASSSITIWTSDGVLFRLRLRMKTGLSVSTIILSSGVSDIAARAPLLYAMLGVAET